MQPAPCLNFVYENTTEESQLRNFLIYAAGVRFSGGKAALQVLDRWSKESLADLVVLLYEKPELMAREQFGKITCVNGTSTSRESAAPSQKGNPSRSEQCEVLKL